MHNLIPTGQHTESRTVCHLVKGCDACVGRPPPPERMALGLQARHAETAATMHERVSRGSNSRACGLRSPRSVQARGSQSRAEAAGRQREIARVRVPRSRRLPSAGAIGSSRPPLPVAGTRSRGRPSAVARGHRRGAMARRPRGATARKPLAVKSPARVLPAGQTRARHPDARRGTSVPQGWSR
jgi:hypothetical protein